MPMSTVQEIEAAIMKLSPGELKRVRDWLEDFAEDQLEFTDEFKAKIARSRQAMLTGERPRVRQP